MNAQDSAGYVGTYSDPATANNPVFTFTRTSGTQPFTMKFSLMNATLKGFLRAAPPAGTYLGDTNAVTAPFSIVPNVGTYTSFTSSSAPPNSFVIAGGPTIRIGKGGVPFTTTLTNGTYTGAALAAHIAARMGVADPATAPPDNFVISAAPVISIKRGATNYTGNLVNGTYTGQELADHIANVMDAADPALAAVADYSGTYAPATGIFTFTRTGTDVTTFGINWNSWAASLQGASAAAGGIKAPTAAATDTTAPFSLATAGGLTATTLYSGSYNTTTGVFTFTRSPAVATSFDILWSNWTASLLTLIGAPSTNATDTVAPFSLPTNGLPPVTTTTLGAVTTNTGPANSTAPLVLYRRSDSGTYDLSDSGNRFLSAFANKYFNGETLSVLADGTPCFLTPGTPVTNPAIPPITVELRAAGCGAVVAGNTMTFLLRGASAISAPGNDCGGFRSLVGLSPCLDNEQFVKIATPYLDPELALSGSSIIGYSENNATGGGGTQPAQGSRDSFGVLTPGGGIRAAQNTPIAESLIDIRTIFTTGIGPQPNSGTPGQPVPFILPLPSVRAIWPIIASQTRKQKTFVIFVTDGDDTCEDAAGSNLGLVG
jgi:hypothetical protein